jgi:hypothetical protein
MPNLKRTVALKRLIEDVPLNAIWSLDLLWEHASFGRLRGFVVLPLDTTEP